MRATLILFALLATMLALMLRPMREECATNDEPAFLVAGYSYLAGYGYRFDAGQPPLAKKWSALPLLFMDVKLSKGSRAFLDPSVGFPMARTWRGEQSPADELFPSGRDSWYALPFQENYALGNVFLYDGPNDPEKLLWAARMMQVVLFLAVGVAVFLWTRRLAGNEAASLATVLWGFNPVTLAYGHLVTTDVAAALTMLLAVWAFAEVLQQPTRVRALLTGAATGAALLTKHTAVLLAPIFVVMFLFKRDVRAAKLAWLIVVAAWVVLILGYAPDWATPPAIPAEQAARLGVPGWFQQLRVLLIPRAFFKGLACQISHSSVGHEGYLFGEWRTTGWWYYYPATLVLKLPVALQLLTLAGLVAALWRRANLTPWLAAGVYLAFAMSNKINIGIRHLLPLIALLAVGTATQLASSPRLVRWGSWLLCGWLMVTAVRAHPNFITYFSEFTGGSAQGYRYLVDSNFDWGQDAKRLGQFLAEHKIGHVYQDYFGSNRVLDYYNIKNTRVFGEEARQLREGILVVSATRLVRPEWAWLRESKHPMTRVTDTLFLFDLAR
jgi:hypothetical protein